MARSAFAPRSEREIPIDGEGGGGGVSLGVPVASCSAAFRPLISLDLAELGALNALVL